MNNNGLLWWNIKHFNEYISMQYINKNNNHLLIIINNNKDNVDVNWIKIQLCIL